MHRPPIKMLIFRTYALTTLTILSFQLQMEIHFGDDQVFTFDKVLAGIIVPEKSKITYSATKVEVQ